MRFNQDSGDDTELMVRDHDSTRQLLVKLMRTSFTSQGSIHSGTWVHFDHETGVRSEYDLYTMCLPQSNGPGLKGYYVPYAGKWT